MNRSLVTPKLFFSLALCAALAGSVAQAQPAKDYQPEVGQAGKDVVWVPTPQALVDKMLDMAKAHAERLSDRSRLRRWPHGHYRGQARLESARH